MLNNKNSTKPLKGRLIRLHECLLGTYERFPSPNLARAITILDTALLLKHISFDVMMKVCHSIQEFQADFPGDLSGSVQAADLVLMADDILFDLPIPFVAVEKEEVAHVS